MRGPAFLVLLVSLCTQATLGQVGFVARRYVWVLSALLISITIHLVALV